MVIIGRSEHPDARIVHLHNHVGALGDVKLQHFDCGLAWHGVAVKCDDAEAMASERQGNAHAAARIEYAALNATRLKSVSLERLAAEPLVGFSREDYPDYLPIIERLFRPFGLKPRFALECDGASSLITAIEAGRGVAVTIPVLKIVSGRRLSYRPVAGTRETFSVGIARAKKGDVTSAGEKFCELLRACAGDIAVTAQFHWVSAWFNGASCCATQRLSVRPASIRSIRPSR